MRLVASDLDHTWVGGDPEALRRLQEAVGGRRETLTLVYATGRDLLLYRELEREAGLIRPDYLIASVGADIYRAGMADFERDPAWTERLADSGWCEQTVDRVAAGQARLVPQPRQFRFKRSYYFEARDAEDRRQFLEELGSRLEGTGVHHRLLYSSARDLDVLPLEAGKGKALDYLRRRLGLEPERTVAFGDSGNDLDLLDRPWCSVVVANARPELLQAKLTPPVFRASEPASRGVLQGLRHFGFLG